MENWFDSVKCAEDSNVPRKSNIISGHVIYKLKLDEDENKKLKARI